MSYKLVRYLIILVQCLLLYSCSNFQKELKEKNIDKRIDIALRYYNDKDYSKVIILLQDIESVLLGNSRAEETIMAYGYSLFYQGDFQLSSYQFKSLCDIYKSSPLVEEAYFMHAKSLYTSTSDYYLDQSNTKISIATFQDFINKYPYSNRVNEADEIMINLRRKLELKNYSISKLYSKLGLHKAAVVSYTNFQKDFPDSRFKEEISFLKILSQYNFAKQSLNELQKERLKIARDYYHYFIDKYPSSEFIVKAENTYVSINKDLSDIQ